jgi:chemotaxis protein methyltransferase CheR
MQLDGDTADLETRLVLEAIHAKYGYDLRGHTLASMRRRIENIRITSGAAHLGELQHRLVTDPEFFLSVRDALTVQQSEMFRDPDFYLTFRQHIVPVLRTYPHLKIWHAGCAGGEEVYSLAILLEEEGLYERTQIYATDLSTGALARAREAVYPESKLSLFSENYLSAGGKGHFDDHCSRAYGRIAIKERLRKNVVLFSHDLASDHALGEMQVVFCRNVLIYFTRPLQERALGTLCQSLPRGGFLCLGASERLAPTPSQHGLSLLPPFVSTYRMGRSR